MSQPVSSTSDTSPDDAFYRPQSGTRKADLDTPALCIDVKAMDANVRTMADDLTARGKQWRPHQKCHKTPQIAQRQLAAGAIGVTCAKVSEAEVMAAGGVNDILIANMIVGEPKLRRLAALCQVADPVVAVDHFAQAQPLSEMCLQQGVTCRVIIEVEVGMKRVGMRPGRDTLELAQGIASLDGIRLTGIMGYEGHLLTIKDQTKKRLEIFDVMDVLKYTRDQLLKDGHNCDIVSAGGTGSFQITADHAAVTELQAGGGIFGDPFYSEKCDVENLTPALTVLATVVSRPALDRAVLDCGRKTLMPDIFMPHVKGDPSAQVKSLSAEHCVLNLRGPSRNLRIGDKIELVVGYSDFATVLHDEFFAFEDDVLTEIWPIAARGKLR